MDHVLDKCYNESSIASCWNIRHKNGDGLVDRQEYTKLVKDMTAVLDAQRERRKNAFIGRNKALHQSSLDSSPPLRANDHALFENWNKLDY